MEPIQLIIELEPGVRPISGQIVTGDRRTVRFAGMLQLLAILETIAGGMSKD